MGKRPSPYVQLSLICYCAPSIAFAAKICSCRVIVLKGLVRGTGEALDAAALALVSPGHGVNGQLRQTA